MSKMISVEVSDKAAECSEVVICLDRAGLAHLIKELNHMNDHFHLMSPNWGGNELADKAHGNHMKVVDHLKVMMVSETPTS